MTPEPQPSEILSPVRVVEFARVGDRWELRIDGVAALDLDRRQSHQLLDLIEASLGSARHRTRGVA